MVGLPQKVLVPRVGDERILGAVAVVAGKPQRLVWNHAQPGDHRASLDGDAGHNVVDLVRRLPAVSAAADQHEARVVLEPVRPGDRQPMLPQRPIHIRLGQELLRGHLEDMHGHTLPLDARNQAVLVCRVRLGHVTVERRLPRGYAWPSDDGQSQGGHHPV